MTRKPKHPRKRALDEVMAHKGYLTPQAAADLACLNLSSIHRLCSEDKLEHVRVGGQEDGKMARIYVKTESLRGYLGPEVAKILKV